MNPRRMPQRLVVRSIYLARGPRVDGHTHFGGRKLYESIRQESSDTLLGFAVVDGDPDTPLPTRIARDEIILRDAFSEFEPDLIFLEGGHAVNIPCPCIRLPSRRSMTMRGLKGRRRESAPASHMIEIQT